MRKIWTWIEHCWLIARSNFCDFRPWGWYKSIDHGDGYCVKTITVNPHKRLSLQKHTYRSERWIVASGQAIVHIDGKETHVCSGAMIEVPLGSVHRLTNSGVEPLVLVEVQLGSRLEESDIQRLRDDYGRS